MILEKYQSSFFIKNLDPENDIQMDFMMDTVLSYENFIGFLGDDKALLDHVYLWDAIIDTNNSLMKDGLNLVILEIIYNDIAENVPLICPTNSNTDNYNIKKQTIILLKNVKFYEPIYEYLDKGKKLIITKRFRVKYETKNNVIILR